MSLNTETTISVGSRVRIRHDATTRHWIAMQERRYQHRFAGGLGTVTAVDEVGGLTLKLDGWNGSDDPIVIDPAFVDVILGPIA